MSQTKKDFQRRYLQAQIDLQKAKAELLELLLKGVDDPNEPLSLQDLKLELDAIENLEVLGPRRDIQGVR